VVGCRRGRTRWRRVEGDGDVVAGREAGLLDGLDEQLHGLLVGAEVGAKPPSSPTAVDRPGRAAPLERVVGLGAPAQRLGERGGADRHDHELLEVDVVVGVLAAVEHVHHRHRQHVGVGAADVAVQRQAELVGGGLGHGERDAEDGVGAEPDLLSVPSRSISTGRRALVEGVEPRRASAISPLTWSTASSTPLPP
jgi:hypothetical protein